MRKSKVRAFSQKYGIFTTWQNVGNLVCRIEFFRRPEESPLKPNKPLRIGPLIMELADNNTIMYTFNTDKYNNIRTKSDSPYPVLILSQTNTLKLSTFRTTKPTRNISTHIKRKLKHSRTIHRTAELAVDVTVHG